MTDLNIIQEIQRAITQLNHDYTQLAVDVAVLKSQMAALMWWFRAIIGAFIIMLATQFWQVVIMRKNNKK